MTDRGPFDAPLACPFLAFEDDRDGRSPRPDHRHRCFVEVRPAPRAIAHQERYCLTAAFATCPTFLDWARREAAAVREPSGEASQIGGAALAGGPESARDRGPADAEGLAEGEERPRRDWAVPPPWAQEGEPGRRAAAVPPFLAGRGGAEGPAPAEPGGRRGGGDAGDRRSAPDVRESVPPAQTAPAGAARLERRAGRDVEEELEEEELEGGVTVIDPASRRDDWRRAEVPPWERPRRYEAYPRLRTRMGLPALPPLLLAAAAVVVAALALFFIPPVLLNLGGEAPASPTPSPTSLASPSTAPSPTPTPGPTPFVYIVKAGDTLSKIAKQFGLSLDALIEANKDTIPNPDRINIGDRIIIPTPPPDVIPGEPSPTASEELPSESP